MDSTTANPHLNVFEPYREPRARARGSTDARGDDRAAARSARPRDAAAGDRRALAERSCRTAWWTCRRPHLVDPSEESAAGGEVERGRLVSVFLTPDTEPFEARREITDIDRGQRFDGVLRFDPDLVVVLESKVCRRWARRNGHRVAELNLGGTRFAQRRTCVLRWHDLLESWWRLVELAFSPPPSRRSCRTCSPTPTRTSATCSRSARCVASAPTPCGASGGCARCCAKRPGSQPERAGLVHVRLDTALGVASLQRAALDIDGRASLITAPLAGRAEGQAEHLYARGHAERLCELAAGTGRRGLARAAPAPARLSQRARAHPRLSHLSPGPGRVRAPLAGRGLEAGGRPPPQPRSFPSCGRGCWSAAMPQSATVRAWTVPARARAPRFAHLRPSIHVSRSWDWNEAERLDDEGLLAGEIHDALNLRCSSRCWRRARSLPVQLLGAERPPSSGDSGAALEQEQPVQAIVGPELGVEGHRQHGRLGGPPPRGHPPRRGSPRRGRARRSRVRG